MRCRFQVWPYLEQFAVDVAGELVQVPVLLIERLPCSGWHLLEVTHLLQEMGTKPDFIIGNYRCLL